MVTVTPDEIRELAMLARLSLNDEEAREFSGQLQDILGYIGKLREVNVDGVPEFLSESAENSSLRTDETTPALTSEQALKGVPRTRGRLVVVPKFKED